MKKIDAIVIHSGGMDSSLCLALAIEEFGADSLLSLSFSYQQRGSNELAQAKKICRDWGVAHTTLSIDCLAKITKNALTDSSLSIEGKGDQAANSLVVGRNGLMARLGAIHADSLGANTIFMGVMEAEAEHSGYRDCSRRYMDLMEEILRIDLDNPRFSIRTPLVFLEKAEAMEIAHEKGILEYLLKETVSCYHGIAGSGCRKCPSCFLRNEGFEKWKNRRVQTRV